MTSHYTIFDTLGHVSYTLARKVKIRLIGIGVFALLAIIVAAVKPFGPDLSPQGYVVIASVILSVGLWAFGSRVFPLAVSSAVMMLLFLTSGLGYSVVFSGYTSRALWILIPALFFGFALTKTGLGKRLAYLVLSGFKPSYLALTASWVIIGIVLSILTPSITVRIAIVVPIAVTITEICRPEDTRRCHSFLMIAAWAMVIIPGAGWLTGSLMGPLALAYFESTPGLEGVINTISWLKAMLFPALLLALVFIVGLYLTMKPREEVRASTEDYRSAYRALGPMTIHEKATLLVLLATFALLVTNQIHHIPDVAICLGAFALLSFVGIIGPRDIGPAISWDLVVFLGSVMGLGTVFQVAGVSTFLGHALYPVVNALAVNPWLILFALMVFLFAWRFVDAAQLYATIPFLLPFLPVLWTIHGIHPLVTYAVIIMAANAFFMAYQQPFAMLAEALAGPAAWNRSLIRRASVIYFLASLVTLAASIPFWMAIGLIR